MRILLVGGRGFLGQALRRTLQAAGHSVWVTVRTTPAEGEIEADFLQLGSAEQWLPLLPPVDVVVNCVGLLRERHDAPFEQVHERAPAALVSACELAGVRRFVHLSALGAAVNGCSAYFRSKGRFEALLQASTLDWAIVRPSLVVGGASTRLFRRLASLPLLVLPGAGRSRVQPVALEDVCQLVLRLVEHPAPLRLSVDAVGPQALPLSDYLQQLRREQGQAPAPVLGLSWPLAFVLGRCAAHVPASLLEPDVLRMLRAGNCASPAALQSWLGRPPRMPTEAAARQEYCLQRKCWQARSALRLALSLVWLGTALVSAGVYPVTDSLQLLAAVGLAGTAAMSVLMLATGVDLLFGLLTLANPVGRRLWQVQAALVVGYTLIISIWLPHWWLHPFGPVLKNLLVLAALYVLHLTEENRHE